MKVRATVDATGPERVLAEVWTRTRREILVLLMPCDSFMNVVTSTTP